MFITRTFSLTNFTIATSALCFQVFVLYPWHQQIDDAFAELRKEQLRIQKEGESARMVELKEIRATLDQLKGRKA